MDYRIIALVGVVAASVGVGGWIIGSEGNEREREEGIRQGKKEAKAENLIEIQHLRGLLEALYPQQARAAEFYDAVVAMTALGYSCASCDGEVSEAEKEAIEMLIGGLASEVLPRPVKDRIAEVRENPPNIKEAHELVLKTRIPSDICDNITSIVINADGPANESEDVFMQAWNGLKAA